MYANCHCIPFTPWHAAASVVLLVAMFAAFWKDDLKWQWLSVPVMWICTIAGMVLALIATVVVFR